MARSICKGRNLEERFFCRIEHFRRIATRDDQLDRRCEAFIAIAAALMVDAIDGSARSP